MKFKISVPSIWLKFLKLCLFEISLLDPIVVPVLLGLKD